MDHGQVSIHFSIQLDQTVSFSKTEILKKKTQPTSGSTTTSCNSCKERKGECRETEGGEDYPEVREEKITNFPEGRGRQIEY